MKQLTITFFLSIISVFSFAQTPFTEQLFLDNAKKMEKDPVQALKSNAVSDYVFVGTGGFITDLKGLMGLYDYYTPVSFTPTDYKIRTYGNSAIVTGRLKHSYTDKKTGAPRILDELITYTYAWINGEWKLTSSQHSEAPYDKVLDNPIEIYKQWVTQYNKDTKAFLIDKCPDDLVGTTNGGAFFNNAGFKDMEGGQQASLEPSDMKSFQSGNLAVVMGIFTSLKKEADGTEKPFKEVFTAVMQKRNGKWHYVGHHTTEMKL